MSPAPKGVIAVVGAFGSSLSVAVALALSPFPIIAALLVLLSSAGPAAGLAFLAGRVLGVAVVVGAAAAISDVLERSESVSPVVAVLRVLVGCALMVLAVLKWRGRPRAETEPDLPAWMGALEGSSPARAAGVAVFLSIANPKELLLGLAAGITIGSAGLPLGATLVVVLAFTVVACVSVAAPVVAFSVAPGRVQGPLEQTRTLLVRHNDAIISVVVLVIGAVLIGGGLSDL
ncbi:MAG: GAP family protein [Cryobacterium sp.]